MSQSLSKIAEHLQDRNYEMAIAQYNDKPQNLSDVHIIELGRAFFVHQNYKKCLELVKPVFSAAKKASRVTQQQKYRNDRILYESGMLVCKTQYLLGDTKKSQQTLMKVQSFTTDSKCLHRISQIKENLNKANLVQKYLMMSKNEINILGKKFIDDLQFQEGEPLELGMPMYAISQIWFDKFLTFCSLKQEMGEYPGIITHFQIIDDRFDSLNDPSSQKQYTNYHFYPKVQVKILSKKCWKKLKQGFYGYDIKRFNVAILGKPKQIMTQVSLRTLTIRKQNQSQQYILQISKKQSFKNVLKKLNAVWEKQGYLYCVSDKKRTIVNQKAILEQTDTSGNIYQFSNYPPTQKQMSTKNKNTILSRCQFCKKTHDLKFCQCKSVKYCDIQCLKQDREKHRKKCQLQMSYLKQKSAILQNFSFKQKSFSGKKGLVGLRNLGNTCYMNSGLQCLSNTRQLTEYFMSNHFLKQINNTNPLGTKGNLACAYAQLIRQMWTGNDNYLSPFNLKKIIGKFAGQFSGYGQQDSQQFISYLLDGLQQDLNLVKHKQNYEIKDQILPDQQASFISSQNQAKRIQSYIRNIMAGQFKSTVICSKCDRKSICFDPYMLVTLSIPKLLKERQVFFIFANPQNKTIRVFIQYDMNSTVGDVKKILEKKFRVLVSEGSWVEFFVVNLNSLQIITQNMSDKANFLQQTNKLNDQDFFMVYEFEKPREGQQLYRIETYYKNNKICFPRFMNLDIKSKGIYKKIFQSNERYIQRRKHGSLSSETLLVRNISPRNGVIQLHLAVQLHMLKCENQRQKLNIIKQKSMLNLQYCLQNFAMTQTLQKNNQWYCNKCKQFVKASKQMQIYKCNKILVLAFKRFSRGYKVKNQIDFPLQNLDMGPFIISNKLGKPVFYDLYGVVNHYGTLYGGHYTAYCKNFLNGRWYQFDDSHVSEIKSRNVISENAYVLFYRLKD